MDYAMSWWFRGGSLIVPDDLVCSACWGKVRWIITGAPEEIRTPDPQIRSLVLRSKLTYAGFIAL